MIASAAATFVDPHVSVGQASVYETIALAKKSPMEAVLRMAFTGRHERLSARRAYELGRFRGALRLALAKFFPKLKRVTLTDYKVRILDTATGTGAKTRVLIQSTDGQREWGTVGVSENIIEASLQALVDSMEFALLKK